jgi:hypothetical protein
MELEVSYDVTRQIARIHPGACRVINWMLYNMLYSKMY